MTLIPWRVKYFLSKNVPLLYHFAVNAGFRANSPEHWDARLAETWNDPVRHWPIKNALIASLTKTRHQVTTAIIPMGMRGKFDNIDLALTEHDLSTFDWLLVVDDDIALPPHFLDLFIYFCWRERLQLAMPAHRFLSHKSFTVTERHWGTVARLTNFVEIGPVTLLHASLFSALTPFPSLRFAWGLDVLWSSEAKRKGWRLGHFRPSHRPVRLCRANSWHA